MKSKLLMFVLLLALCAFPVLAQDSTLNSVSFNGFSFSFDSAWATNVNISRFAGDPVDAQQPGGPEVPHTQFLLYSDTILPESFDAPGVIRIYQASDIAVYPNAAPQFQQLQTLLTDRPDLAQFMVSNSTLPFLPTNLGPTQVVRARAQYVETPSVRGISYVTMFRFDVSPFTSSEFLYTFQGISLDGTQYVSAIFHVDAAVFPAEIPSDFDFAAFEEQYEAYVTESINQLNAATVENFTPSLSAIDAVIQSFAFGSVPVVSGGATPLPPPATATIVNEDPTFGGLAGVTWTLVSYGAPEAPIAVLPEAPITAIFSETGVGGSAGCNSYGGAFLYNSGALTVSGIVSTLMACAENVMAQETAYVNALTTATSYQIVGGQLIIAYTGGQLVFVNPLAITPTVTITPVASATPTATP
jgi:heat shock protein HslJ